MKLIKNNAFFLPGPAGNGLIPITTSSKLKGAPGYSMGNSGNRNCSAMMFTSYKGCASCGSSKK